MSDNNIDENRQSRTIATFGLENIKKISKLSIFIQGINANIDGTIFSKLELMFFIRECHFLF